MSSPYAPAAWSCPTLAPAQTPATPLPQVDALVEALQPLFKRNAKGTPVIRQVSSRHWDGGRGPGVEDTACGGRDPAFFTEPGNEGYLVSLTKWLPNALSDPLGAAYDPNFEAEAGKLIDLMRRSAEVRDKLSKWVSAAGRLQFYMGQVASQHNERGHMILTRALEAVLGSPDAATRVPRLLMGTQLDLSEVDRPWAPVHFNEV